MFTALELDTSGPVEPLAVNGIQLASSWQPDAESLLQVANLSASYRAITFYGVGIGGLPEQLLQRLSLESTLPVVLMGTSFFNTTLDVLEQRSWL